MSVSTSADGARERRAALVTGGSRGIGAAVALRLAADGLDVVVNYRHDRAAADHVIGTIVSAGGRAVAAAGDVGDPDGARELFDVAFEHFGRLDVVVSNAGVGHSGALAEARDEDFDRVFATNTRGTFLVLREAARRLADAGRIVVISRASLRPQPGGGIYAASKAAGDVLVRAAAQELGARGITVNSVQPGATRTDMWTKRAGHVGSDEAVADRTALGRLGEPDDIAEVVGFLASDAARWITGQAIAADGGLV